MSQKKFWFLSRSRVLKDLSSADAELLENMLELQRVRRRQPIYLPGDPADRIYLLKSGLVKISKVTPEGKELTLMFLTPGSIFGELAVIGQESRNTMAEAYEDCTVYSMERDAFLAFIVERPALALEVTRLIAERRQALENKIDNLLFKGAHARLASLFLDLANDFGVRDSRGVIVNIKLTHREMANLIGSTRETVSFALIDMKRDGAIETDGKRVVILKPDLLEGLRDGS